MIYIIIIIIITLLVLHLRLSSKLPQRYICLCSMFVKLEEMTSVCSKPTQTYE